MGVTIKDVARKTGLSVTTVSLVLNKKRSRISEKTKQLIESAAQELNYTPNQTAVSLVTRKTQLIGLVLPENSYFYFADLVHSVESACRNTGYHLMLVITGQSEDEVSSQMEDLIRQRVDGLIFDPSLLSENAVDFADAILGHEECIVSLGYINSQLLPNAIAPAHRQGGYLSTQHLLELGHRKIGYIGGPAELNAASDLHCGYREALEEYGLEYDSALAFEGAYDSATGAQGLTALVQQGITAVITGSDLIACGVFRAAQQLGISIPEDLSVVGYGASALCEELYVPLTTVSVHFDRIARKAVNLIRKRDDAHKFVPPEMITPSLLERSSTARPGIPAPTVTDTACVSPSVTKQRK